MACDPPEEDLQGVALHEELVDLLEALFDLAGQKQTKSVEDLLSSEMEEFCKAKLSSRLEDEKGD